MDFSPSERTEQYRTELLAFMDDRVYPAEAVNAAQIAERGDPTEATPVLRELKVEARSRGLWNLFLPDSEYGAGLDNVEYAPLRRSWGAASS
jgi:acyl-CoA dehydrogenase